MTFNKIFPLFAAAALVTTNAQAPASGSYWAVYDAAAGPATESCLQDTGSSVDAACCTGAPTINPHAPMAKGDTCLKFSEDMAGPFTGCLSEGVYGYGEDCTTDKAPFLATDAADCGCEFKIQGDGCFKANDLPGQQWFVYLDGKSCPATTPPPAGAYWAVYNATSASPAPASCVTSAAGTSVSLGCCTGAPARNPHEPMAMGNTCLKFSEDMAGPFTGCLKEGVYGYGEDCTTDKAPFVATDAQDCGCEFVLEGTGCYKANDLPGQQWFVYLPGDTCTAESAAAPSWMTTAASTTAAAAAAAAAVSLAL